MNRGNILAVSGLVLAGMVMTPCLTRGAPIIPRQMAGVFRAGAFAQDITAEHFPIVVNGNFKPKFVEKALDPLHARCLVLDDGRGPIAMAVVDSCVLDRAVMDEAKRLASGMTGIPTGRIFISATHTHSAPAAVSILGTDHDPRYRAWLPGKIAEGISNAMGRRETVQVGWAVEKLPEVVQSRRWIARPDRIKRDPFGEFTTRATMHPGRRNPDWEEPSGPMNPDVNVLAVRRLDGSPLALFASFSIHYVGSDALSADYFGIFAQRVGDLLEAGGEGQSFLGLLANGVSGDAYLTNYTLEKQASFDKQSVAETVAHAAARAYRRIDWQAWLPLDVRECDLELNVRAPKTEWAKRVLADVAAGREKPDSQSSVYAREQMILAGMPPTRMLKLQALRIGTLAMVGIPCEVFAITGLRIAAQSPFAHTFTVMLANGYDGYLPPPEQMAMGGYTTWLARSSCLEAEAEPAIIATVRRLLEGLHDGKRCPRQPEPITPYAAAVLASRPSVFWRMDELNGPCAVNAVDGARLGTFGHPTAYAMPGAQAPAFPGLGRENRVPHFIGVPFAAPLPDLGRAYTVELWFYNCMPTDARPVTGYLFACGAAGDRLAIGGTVQSPGRLVFHAGKDLAGAVAGHTEVPLRNWVAAESWHHVALVRDGERVSVYLDGRTEPELTAVTAMPARVEQMWIGGTAEGEAGFEGRCDEVAVYARALTAEDVAAHYRAACGSASGGIAGR